MAGRGKLGHSRFIQKKLVMARGEIPDREKHFLRRCGLLSVTEIIYDSISQCLTHGCGWAMDHGKIFWRILFTFIIVIVPCRDGESGSLH